MVSLRDHLGWPLTDSESLLPRKYVLLQHPLGLSFPMGMSRIICIECMVEAYSEI